ncbi:MAG: mechanosensitive ion channel family protein [Clostridia bacterium]|nr:mechanosensitive ion channel family protein [Clostridia bacterium]
MSSVELFEGQFAALPVWVAVAVKAALVLILGYVLMKIVLHLLTKAISKTGLDEALHRFIVSAAKVLLWIVLLVTLLGVLNIPTSTFITVIGACGAAIALALKDSLGNIAGGIIILVTHPFRKDDYISINGTEGKVEHIDLLVSTLKTLDNKLVSVPNGIISTSVLVNFSANEKRRVDCSFAIGYNDDITKAKEILLNVTESCPEALSDPEPAVGVRSLDDSGVALDLLVWCATPDYWTVKYFLEENVKLAFDEAGITIPYPQMEVKLKK